MRKSLKIFSFLLYIIIINTTRDMRSVLNVYPGESVDVVFPEGFTVEYNKIVWEGNTPKRIIGATVCTRMNAYYWDDDDHRCLDFYFYNDNEESKGPLGVSHFAKFWDLTPESRNKVEEFVKSNYKG